LAFERTPERRGDRDLGANAGGARFPRNIEPGSDSVLDAAALIPLTEGLAGGDGHADFLAARRECAVETPAVQHEADELRSRCIALEGSKHRFRVRHLRHTLRIHEASDLDAVKPGVREPAD